MPNTEKRNSEREQQIGSWKSAIRTLGRQIRDLEERKQFFVSKIEKAENYKKKNNIL